MFFLKCGSVMAKRLRKPNSNSGISDQQSVGSSPSRTLVSLLKSRHLHNVHCNHCFVLRKGSKAVGPMCFVTPVKEPSALIGKRRGSPNCSWLWLLNAP